MTTNSNNSSPTISEVLTNLIGELDSGNTNQVSQLQNLNQSTTTGFEKLTQTLTSATQVATQGSSAGKDFVSSLNPLNGGGGLGSSLLSGLLLGPLWKGIFSLFQNNNDTPAPVLEPYSFPQAANIERPATSAITALSVDGTGLSRTPAPAQAPIQISIQALDARSILDRSDDIASALKQAMLSNHEINDNLSEL